MATITTPPASPTAPSPAPTSSSQTAAATGWYLALGDSLAAGYQPPGGDQKTRGYAGPVLEGVRKTQPGTQLTNLGCSGETTTSMLRGGLCRYPEGSQIAAAVAFLKGNAATTRLITLDMGANNVLRCARPALDQACATSTTTTVAKELATILGQIRAAAPSVPIVVLTYYNPLLAGWLTGPEGQDDRYAVAGSARRPQRRDHQGGQGGQGEGRRRRGGVRHHGRVRLPAADERQAHLRLDLDVLSERHPRQRRRVCGDGGGGARGPLSQAGAGPAQHIARRSAHGIRCAERRTVR